MKIKTAVVEAHSPINRSSEDSPSQLAACSPAGGPGVGPGAGPGGGAGVGVAFGLGVNVDVGDGEGVGVDAGVVLHYAHVGDQAAGKHLQSEF